MSLAFLWSLWVLVKVSKTSSPSMQKHLLMPYFHEPEKWIVSSSSITWKLSNIKMIKACTIKQLEIFSNILKSFPSPTSHHISFFFCSTYQIVVYCPMKLLTTGHYSWCDQKPTLVFQRCRRVSLVMFKLASLSQQPVGFLRLPDLHTTFLFPFCFL